MMDGGLNIRRIMYDGCVLKIIYVQYVMDDGINIRRIMYDVCVRCAPSNDEFQDVSGPITSCITFISHCMSYLRSYLISHLIKYIPLA